MNNKVRAFSSVALYASGGGLYYLNNLEEYRVSNLKKSSKIRGVL